MEFSSSCHISLGLDVFCKKIAIIYHPACHEKSKVWCFLSFIMLWTNVIHTWIHFIYKCPTIFDRTSRVFILCWSKSAFARSINDLDFAKRADTWLGCFQCWSIGWCLVLISDFIATNFLLFLLFTNTLHLPGRQYGENGVFDRLRWTGSVTESFDCKNIGRKTPSPKVNLWLVASVTAVFKLVVSIILRSVAAVFKRFSCNIQYKTKVPNGDHFHTRLWEFYKATYLFANKVPNST